MAGRADGGRRHYVKPVIVLYLAYFYPAYFYPAHYTDAVGGLDSTISVLSMGGGTANKRP